MKNKIKYYNFQIDKFILNILSPIFQKKTRFAVCYF